MQNANLHFIREQISTVTLSQIKIQNRDKFFKFLFLLSGDVELNPGPVQLEDNSQCLPDNYHCFKERGLHFVHLNINSILPKIDELRLIAQNTNAAVIGLTETKLDETILNEEIEINGYTLDRCDRNRKGGGVACYIRNDISFNIRENFSNEIENIFLDILLPKTKPILIGIVYRPPDQYDFLEHFSEAINNTYNFVNQEVYILGDFNINLIKNKHISNLMKPYVEVCSLHGLKQLIDSPTRITETSSTLLDHILTNSHEKVSQFGVLDLSLSDHQIIYCTRKIVKQKFNKHNYIRIRSLRNYSKNLLLEKLETLQFPDYSNYNNIDTAYTDFIDKTIAVINEIAPFKQVCIKNNTSEWIDEEVLAGIRSRDKLYVKFKKSRLHNDNLKYKRARNHLQNVIKRKKKNFITNKLTENIGKPKDLWKTLKKIGLPSKVKAISNICLEKNGKISFDSKTNCEIFKDFFANLATNLVNNLPIPTNVLGIESINRYYANLNLQNQNFSLHSTTRDVIRNYLNI